MTTEEILADMRKRGACPNLDDDTLRGLIRYTNKIIKGSPLLKGGR